MATLSTTVATLKDWAKTRDPDGTTADVVDMLSQENAMLEDMMFIEGNLPTGNQTTVQTGEPSTTWRKLNQGVNPSKGTTAQIIDNAAMLQSISQVDVKIAQLNGDVAAFRMQQAQPHLTAMSKEAQATSIYGNGGTSPEEFDGVATRYNDLSANNATNILDGGGTGSDNLSIWLLGWGENQIHGIFPKGSVAGLERDDRGIQLIQTGTGITTGHLRAYVEIYDWTIGLAVPDWRYASRVANIDASDLSGVTSAADMSELMTRASYRLPSLNSGTPIYYGNRTSKQMLDILNRNDVISGGGLKFENVDGVRVETFRGIPFKLVDQLTVTEARVT